MKPSIRFLVLAGLFVSFIFASCKTQDTGSMVTSLTGAAGQDLSDPADDDSLEVLAQAIAKAEESRSLADYVNGSVYCPNEWTLAENRYKAAKNKSDEMETKGEVYARVAEWSGIKLAYDEIANMSTPQFAGEQEKVLAAARDNAVKAGVGDLVPDRLAIADACAASSKEKYENGDISGSIKDGKEAKDRYQILQTLAEAHAKQMEADSYDFFSRDSDIYLAAASAGNDAVDLYDEGDLAAAALKANEALSGFDQVIKNGWSSIVEEKAFVTRESRAAAQEVKADVAVKSDYAAAEQVYNQANVALRAGQYTQAMDLFEKADALYIVAYENALEKRKTAEEVLRRTEQILSDSEEYAQDVQDVIGGDE